MVEVKPGKRYWRANGTITPPLLAPTACPPPVAAVEPQGRAYASDGTIYPPLPPTPTGDPASYRLVAEYVPPVEVFTDYRVIRTEIEGMTISESAGSRCIHITISPKEVDAATMRAWAAVLTDMADTLDRLPEV